MKKDVKTVLDTQSRDQVASAMEHEEIHHAVVVNKDGKFVGLVSAWDVTAECARDARAWPWTRTVNGKVHPIHPATGVH
jgi:CBS domain-containing protein